MTELWGIDLGGTKIEGAILKSADGPETRVRLRIDTEADQGFEHIVDRIETVLRRLEEESGTPRPSIIGIGTPGSRDAGTSLMRNCNSTALNGRNLLNALQSRCGTSFIIANDANCFALAEARLGAGVGHRVVFGVILGTGVGGGIVVDGEFLDGPNGIAGEWGHIPMPGIVAGEACYCGATGCVETVLSGPALERYYYKLNGSALTFDKIVDEARGGNEHAREAVQFLCEQFGRAMAVVVNILDPDVIVVGGGVGNTEILYSEGARQMHRHIFHDSPRVQLVKPMHGDSAGVLGAALLVQLSSVPDDPA